ncbi:MAG: site-specific integrase [Methanoregula sp.]
MAAKAPSTKIRDYVAKYSNKSSGAGYRGAIESFLRSAFDLDKKDSNGNKHDYESLLVQYLTDKKRDHSNDVKKFSEKLIRESRSKQSARQILTYAVKFLRVQGVIVLPEFVQDIKRECKGGAATIDESLTNEMICRILHGADVRNRAIFLVAASSGLRIGELLSLSMNDINFDSTPVRVTVRADKAKNKHARFSFITTEAYDAVKAWLKHRDSYLLESAKHNQNLMKSGHKTAPVKTDSDLLFPVSDSSVNAAWESCLIKAGLHEKNKVKAFKFHSLRKFFYSRLAMALPEKLVQALVGHNGYLDGSYLRITPEYAGAEYQKVQDVLTCCVPETVKAKITTLEKETANLQKNDATQYESIEYLRSINKSMEKRMVEMQERLTAMERAISRGSQVLQGDPVTAEAIKKMIAEQLAKQK